MHFLLNKPVRYALLLIASICVIGFNLNMYLNILSFMMIYNIYDLVGYGEIMHKLKDVNKKLYDETIFYYRILQYLFLGILLAVQSILFDLHYIIVFVLYLFTGIQDVLYYLVGGHKFPNYWSWLDWSYIGWFWKRNKENKKMIPNKILLLEIFIAGVLITVIVEILFKG